MMSTQPHFSPSNAGLKPVQYGVIVIGVVVFVLLLFADRTALNNKPGQTASSQPAQNSDNRNSQSIPPHSTPSTKLPTLQDLPALPNDAALTGALKGLANAKTAADSSKHLAIITSTLEKSRRYDAAALFYQFKQNTGSLTDEQTQQYALALANAAEMTSITPEQQTAFGLTALPLLKTLVESNPNNETLVTASAGLTVRFGQPMEGITKLKALVEKNPNNYKATILLARYSMETRQYDKAEGRIQAALKLNPNEVEPHFLMGVWQLEHKNDKSAAKQALQKALALAQEPTLKQQIEQYLKSIK